MVILYKRKYGIYKKVAEYNSVKQAEASLDSRFGKGRYIQNK